MNRFLRRAIPAALGVCAAFAACAQAPLPRAVVLPLEDEKRWQTLTYRSLPPHRLRFSAAGLKMAVERSAMPVIYPLPAPLAVTRIRVQGRVEGELRLPPERQGEEKFDDYVLRVGLVEPGARTLNFVQRQAAAPWVRRLFELAPAGSGIARIHFFNVGADPAHVGRERQHPLSELIVERVVAVPRADGRFDFSHAPPRPLQALAVWLSADGDDSGSTFTVLIERIELEAR